jgi:predicted GNAT family N-acyltransferase
MNIVKIKKLDKELTEPVLSLINNSFGLHKLPDIDFHYCGLVSDELVAYCALQEREIEIVCEKYRVLILGLVTVRDRYRNNGFCKELLNQVLNSNKHNDVDGIVLNCGENIKMLYEKMGFIRISDCAMYERSLIKEIDNDPVYYYPLKRVIILKDRSIPVYLGSDF